MGAASITVTVPGGQRIAGYYLQAIGDSGDVTYKAMAPEFEDRTATVMLTKSGIIVGYDLMGPPPEAFVKNKVVPIDDRRFSVSLSSPKPSSPEIAIWSAFLGPQNGRAADFTVRPLRAGVSAMVVLTSSDPAVGTVESPLTIQPGTSRALGKFTPLREGTTVLSISTPPGFTRPGNATSVPAIVGR